jgi:hypothetical protein
MEKLTLKLLQFDVSLSWTSLLESSAVVWISALLSKNP